MTVYPFTVEPHQEDLNGTPEDMFVARFPDLPELTDCIGIEREDAILNAIERVNWALTDLYLAGKPMPLCSPLPEGGLGAVALLVWRS